MEEKHTIKKLIKFFLIFILITILILLYSRYIGTKNIKIHEYKIVNTNFTNDYYGLKIVHISDIHYGKTTFIEELNELVKKVNKVKPDIIIFTGDLIDKDTEITTEEADKISSILSKMSAKVGKYAISGDQDYKYKNYDLLLENIGFTNLNDKYDLIYLENSKYMMITGISSNLKNKKDINEKIKDSDEYLKEKKDEEKPFYSILIMHEADYIKDINLNNYNLVLAGHSLNGQVRIPFIGTLKPQLPKGSKKYYDKYYKIKNTDLYISNGIGTTNNKFRLFNKPSVNLYRLTDK